MRFLAILLGYVLAAVGGCAVGLVGTFNWAIEQLNHGQHAPDFDLFAFLLHYAAMGLIDFTLTMVLVPLALIVVAVIVSEIYAVRTWFAWSIGLGAAFAAVPSVLLPGRAPMGPLGFFVAGFVAGTLYWLVAGRDAGPRMPTPVVAQPDTPTGG